MNSTAEDQIITKNNSIDQKTGKTCRVEISSTNGLTYIVQNVPNSKTRSTLSLKFNGDIVFTGSLNNSNYRADSFTGCDSHHIFKLSKQEIKDFLESHKDSVLGTVFMDYMYNGYPNMTECSCIWIDRKINIICKEKFLNMYVKTLSKKHTHKRSLKNFLINNTTAERLDYYSSLDNNIEIVTINQSIYVKEHSLIAFYDKEKQECKIVVKENKEADVVKEFKSLNKAKYNKLLKDEIMSWAIKHAKGNFKTSIDEYGFTEDMTYNQAIKIKQMVEI